MNEKTKNSFQKTVYDYYNANKRSLAWRDNPTPYQVVVSEIMLQQTQVDRVAIKFPLFMERFPALDALAAAPVHAVLAAWQGLGYNRRALALHQFAQRVQAEFGGRVPIEPSVLETFKGIGPATAASIVVYAYNEPHLFIETNVRAVFIHHFFKKTDTVHDKELVPLVAATVDSKHPREWYYALMDYGTMLKKQHKNPSRRSAHYAVQSKFEGSDRQVRGLILKLLTQVPSLSEHEIVAAIPREESVTRRILSAMEQEGFIVFRQGYYTCRA
jgi:A/G-specific adenine glycosylase